MKIPYRYLRRWGARTALKGVRERWPLRLWALYGKALWHRWSGQWFWFCVERGRVDKDLEFRRSERVFGDGAARAMGRKFNAAIGRERVKLDALRRGLMGVAE